jgi:PAS domain-containing protein
LLIATSTDESPFLPADGRGVSERLAAGNSAMPLIRGAADALLRDLGDYRTITDAAQFRAEISGRTHLLQVLPVSADCGIDWLVVTVIPESDFMAQIWANTRTTGVLIAAALLLSGLLGIGVARWMARPVLRLNTLAQRLANCDWPQAEPGDVNRIAEIRQLESSFLHMAGQLQRTLESLTTEAAERKRAMALLHENEERLSLVLEGAELGMWDWNVQTGRVVFNERWAQMLGYSLDEIEPSVDGWRRLLHPSTVCGPGQANGSGSWSPAKSLSAMPRESLCVRRGSTRTLPSANGWRSNWSGRSDWRRLGSSPPGLPIISTTSSPAPWATLNSVATVSAPTTPSASGSMRSWVRRNGRRN